MSAISFTDRLPQVGQMSPELLALIADHRRTLTGTALASAARTTTTTSATLTNHDCQGVLFFLNISVAGGAGGLSLYLNVIDPLTANSVNLNSGPTVRTTANTFATLFHPALSNWNPAYDSASVVVPRSFRAYVLHATADSYTYSVSYCLLP